MGLKYPVAYYIWKMTKAKIYNKRQDTKFLAIIKAFKNWWHYLKDCQYKVMVMTNYKNLCGFMKTMSFSFR